MRCQKRSVQCLQGENFHWRPALNILCNCLLLSTSCPEWTHAASPFFHMFTFRRAHGIAPLAHQLKSTSYTRTLLHKRTLGWNYFELIDCALLDVVLNFLPSLFHTNQNIAAHFHVTRAFEYFKGEWKKIIVRKWEAVFRSSGGISISHAACVYTRCFPTNNSFLGVKLLLILAGKVNELPPRLTPPVFWQTAFHIARSTSVRTKEHAHLNCFRAAVSVKLWFWEPDNMKN